MTNLQPGELFLSRANVNIVGVPYRSGGESVTAVLSEAVHMTFEGITILLPLIREGKVRALAVTSRTRTSLAPDLPTMIEAGVPDYEVTTFNGMMAPAGTPAAIVQRLNTTINEGVQAPDMQETITKLGAVTNQRLEQLLRAVSMRADVHALLELEVHGRRARVPDRTRVREAHLDAPERVGCGLDVPQRNGVEIDVLHGLILSLHGSVQRLSPGHGETVKLSLYTTVQ